MTRYRTIVVDPPWDHTDGTGVDVETGNITAIPYEAMSLDEIAALDIKSLSDNVDQDAHLYLWTTSRYLRDAFDIARGWGFHYSAALVWCKAPRGFGPGGIFQNNVEFVLFCRRPSVTLRPEVLKVTTYVADAADRAGITRAAVDRFMGTSDMAGWWLSRLEHRCACPTDEQWPRLKAFLGLGDEMDELVATINAKKGTAEPRPLEKATSRWFAWPRTEHSAKPEAFLDLVEQVSPGPRLEVFARRARFGWDYAGDGSLGTVEIPGLRAPGEVEEAA